MSAAREGTSWWLPRGRPALLLSLGALELTFLATLGWWPGARFPLPGFLLFGGAFGVYLVAAWAVGSSERTRVPRHGAGASTRPGTGTDLVGGRPDTSAAQRTRVTIWVVAVGLRLALLPLTPELSDDVYRYLWDGHVQLAGVNPYLHAPADPALDSLANSIRPLVNNPDVRTIYPPVAQIAFLLVTLAGGTLFRIKLLWLGLDLGTGWLVERVARTRGRSGRTAGLLYLWSPLLVVETTWSGHLEVLGLMGLVLLLYLTGKPVLAGAAGAWSALTKFAPAAALPALVRRLGWRFLAGFLLTTAVLYAPYAGAGSRLFDGLATYARHWRFNEGVFGLLELALPGPTAPRLAAGACVLAVIAWTTLRRYGPERALLWILAAGLVVSPTLHPWYALWILPLAALRRSRAWIVFTGTVFVGYWGLPTFRATGTWPQPLWGRLLIWLPVAALLALEFVERRRSPPEVVPLPRGSPGS